MAISIRAVKDTVRLAFRSVGAFKNSYKPFSYTFAHVIDKHETLSNYHTKTP